MIGRSGERGSGISALAARHDDDDDIFLNPSYCFLMENVGIGLSYLQLWLNSMIDVAIFTSAWQSVKETS